MRVYPYVSWLAGLLVDLLINPSIHNAFVDLAKFNGKPSFSDASIESGKEAIIFLPLAHPCVGLSV